MLSLIEDKQIICDIFNTYLTKTNALNWKYEHALLEVTSHDLMCTDVAADMKSLEQLYHESILKLTSNSDGQNQEEEAKINAILEIITQICSAPPIKKLLLKCLYKTNMQNEVLDQITKEEEQRAKAEKEKAEKKKAEKRYSSMTTIEKFDHLAKYHGTEGTLDLQNAILPRRFKIIKKMKMDLTLSLQPLVTLRERDTLVEVSECKNQNDVEELLSRLYQKKDLSPNERYIRFALAAAHEIWSTGLLKKKGHGEDWYRLHVYSNIWDKAFILDGDFETKRSECISRITSALQEIDSTTKLQKIDFILRDLNTENDFLSVEEKPSRKGVKADLKKGRILQKQTLQLWSKKIKSIPLIGELETITCQWEGLKLTTFASKLLPSGRMLSYVKSVANMPVNYKHCPEFARLLMNVLSVKYLVIQNYEKFNIILNEKYKQEIETLHFDEPVPSDHISVRSDSTQAVVENDDNASDDGEVDADSDADKEVLDILKSVKFGDDVKSFSDWEDLLLHDSRKRRRRSHQ